LFQFPNADVPEWTLVIEFRMDNMERRNSRPRRVDTGENTMGKTDQAVLAVVDGPSGLATENVA